MRDGVECMGTGRNIVDSGMRKRIGIEVVVYGFNANGPVIAV